MICFAKFLKLEIFKFSSSDPLSCTREEDSKEHLNSLS